MTGGMGRAAAYMLAGALAFAVMNAMAHELSARGDWIVVVVVRAFTMLAFTAGLARLAGVRLSLNDPPTLWMRSVAGSVSLVCNFYAMAHLPVADAVVLINVHPLFLVLAEARAARRFPLGDALGVACGLAGVVLIQRPHGGGDRFAAAVAVFSSLATSISMTGLHRLRNVDARVVVTHFAGVASVVSAAWLATRPGAITRSLLAPTTLLMLAAVGAAGTLGQICITKAYAAGAPARVSVVGLSQVVFAMVFDVFITGRFVPPVTLLGMALVLGPTAYFTTRPARRPHQPGGDRPVAGALAVSDPASTSAPPP